MSLWTRKKYITTMGTIYPMHEHIGGHIGHDTFEEAIVYQITFNSDPDHPDRSEGKYGKYDYMGHPKLNPRSDADK